MSDKVVIYQHGNYEGASQELGVGSYDINTLSIGNDQLSSLKVPKGMRVTLHEHGGFTGRTKSFTDDTPWVGDDFNDLTSSIKVEQLQKVVIYQHGNYEGASQELGVGSYDINTLSIGNDQLSSLKVPKGMRVILYEHGGFTGRTKSFTEDAPWVGDDFNDLTSSIKVEQLQPEFPDSIPGIQFGSAPYDVHGSWNHMAPYTRDLIDKIQRDPTQLKLHVENGIRTSRFLNYIQQGGEKVFGDAQDKHGNPVKLARWTDTKGFVHEFQLKVGLNPAANAASTNLTSPVPESGTTGHFIASSQGDLCFTVQRIKTVTTNIGTASTIIGVLEYALTKVLTRSLAGLRRTAQNAAELAELAYNAGVDAEAAAARVVRVQGVIKWVKWSGRAAMILGVLALLVDGFFALFHKMTFSLEMWNETDVDLEWSITYQAGDTYWINNQNGLKPKDWQQFPKKNAVDDGLMPLGGGLEYDKVASVDIVFANGSEHSTVSTAAIKACVSIRQKGGTENACVLLIDVPLVGHNKMHLGAGKGDESYYKSAHNSATDRLRFSFNFTVGGKTLTAQISTDQVSGETNYGGITGYNYNALLYIKEATS